LGSDDEGWDFAVPRRRHDVTREVDLIEEVLRHWGYDNIEASLPSFTAGARSRLPWEKGLEALRASLVGAGYHQAIHYSFGDRADMDSWALSFGRGSERFATLQNPLAENRSTMRTSLVPGLLRAASNAVRRGESNLCLFEDGSVYFKPGDGEEVDTPLVERPALALVALGAAGPSLFQHSPAAMDLLTLKGALMDGLRVLAGPRAGELRVVVGDAPNGAPGSTAELRLGDRRVGWLCRVHPKVLAPLEIEEALYAAEVDLTELMPTQGVTPNFLRLSRFPKAVRDLCVLVDRNHHYGDILDTVEGLRTGGQEARGGGADTALIESIELIDRYLGKGVPEEKVSLTFSVTYRRRDRTLTQDEVDSLHDGLLATLVDGFGAELRA
jgi:phenylalanyl-tRNA synthetase beta chain